MDYQHEPGEAPVTSEAEALKVEGADVLASNCDKILEPESDVAVDGAMSSSQPLSSMAEQDHPSLLPSQQNIDSVAVAPERGQEDLTLTFPQQLMEILNRDEEHGDIISWLPHGRGFMIYKKKQFETDVMPKYFNKHSKYTSFTRKLNRWGFVRITRGAEMGAYYNPQFQRGEEKMCAEMTCQRPGGGTAVSNEGAGTIPAHSVPHMMAGRVSSTSHQTTPLLPLIGGGGGAVFSNHQQVANANLWQQLPTQQRMHLLMSQREALWRSQLQGAASGVGGAAAGGASSMVTNAATRQLLQQSMGRVGSGGGPTFWSNGGAGGNGGVASSTTTSGGGAGGASSSSGGAVVGGNNLPGIHPMILGFGAPAQNQQHRQQGRFPGPPPS
eukprot:Nitzschia sp. Nitz4//scaffold115_size69933//55923//57608//NITZ4_006010-RA/size69933-snap-gene-0.88-mRNA-1//-1//CDS//3329533523//4228//frame0